jgi:hypothetical protein
VLRALWGREACHRLKEGGGVMDEAMVGLAEAIEALRQELTVAAGYGQDQQMRFTIEPIELVMEVAVTKDASGKIGWQILEAGGGYEKVSTQTLTLRLAPLWQTPEGTLTKDFAIAAPSLTEDFTTPDRH